MSTSMIPLIALGSAGLYSVVMIAMKFWWKIPGVGLGLLIVLTLRIKHASTARHQMQPLHRKPAPLRQDRPFEVVAQFEDFIHL